MYIDELAGIFNKYNNKYHSKIKIKPFGVKFSTYIDFGVEKNDKDTRFMVGDNVKKSKYDVFSDLNDEKLLERFMKKNCKKTNQNILG